jgi:quinol-cytochrome oxidoreductase complex cytochrome b subunit
MKKPIKILFFIILSVFVFFSYKALALDDNIFPKDPQSFSPPSGVRPNTSSNIVPNNVIEEKQNTEIEKPAKNDNEILAKENQNLNNYSEIKSISIVIPIFIVFIAVFFLILLFLVFYNLKRN